jgi:two-component system, NtrC family, response regulator HydG
MKTNFRILLTDDNQEFTQNLHDILELKGYGVVIANDGFQALEIIKSSKVDLILMDIKMPVMNGVETYKKIKVITPGTPVIMLTAFALEELIQESMKEGAFACLKKPLDFDELFATIDRAIHSGSMILVVDDDESLCQNLMDILTGKGYRVSIATDGSDAIKKVSENIYDILLLDMKLPPLNGLEVYLNIRSLNPKVVVIIFSGYSKEMVDMIDSIKKEGAYTLLEKPINIDNLLTLLERIENKNGITDPRNFN